MALVVYTRDRCSLYSNLPLRQGSKRIRILELSRGARPDTLQGQLSCVDLLTARYQALSYTWGSSVQERYITLNGRFRTPITDNLYNALHRLRECSVRTVWVDALCIDQQNLAERSAQVQLMGEIYGRADAVDIWLGEPGFVPKVDKSLLCNPYITETSSYVVVRDTHRSFCSTRSGRFLDDRNFFSFFLCSDALRFEQALRHTRPRWQDRGWVVQEFILAKTVYLCAGSARRRWKGSPDDFAAVEPIIHEFADKYPCLEAFMIRMWRITECIPRFISHFSKGEEYGATLFQTYHFLRDTETADPRDKIYCLMSILQRREAAHLPAVNYSLTAPEVFAQATCGFLTTAPVHAHIGGNNSTRSFDTFALVTLTGERLCGLPSWCIDFCHLQAVSQNISNENQIFGRRKRRSAEDCSTHLPRIIDPKLTLEVVGYIPGEVADVHHAALPLHAKNAYAEEKGCAVENVEVHSFAEGILVFARQALSRKRRRNDCDARHHVSHLTSLKYGPRQLDELDASSLFLGKSGKYLAYGNVSTHNCMEYALSKLLSTYVRAMGSSTKDYGTFDYLEYCRCAGGMATLFATSTGLLGLAPSSIECHDIIIARPCSIVAMLLRPHGRSYTFHGLVYLSGSGVLWGADDSTHKLQRYLVS